MLPLFPSEAAIALAVLGAERAHLWPSIAAVDQRKGLPEIDRTRGGRYWPAVLRFYEQEYGLDVAAPGTASLKRVRMATPGPDGEEDFDAEKEASIRGRRHDRRPVRARA